METEIYIYTVATWCIIFSLIALLVMLFKKRVKSIALVLLIGLVGRISAYYFPVIEHMDFLAVKIHGADEILYELEQNQISAIIGLAAGLLLGLFSLAFRSIKNRYV